jgi:hypothetical protein
MKACYRPFPRIIRSRSDRTRRLFKDRSARPLPSPSKPSKRPLWRFAEDGRISFFRNRPRPLPEPDFRSVADALHDALERPETIRFPFGINGADSAGVHVVPPGAMPSASVWFLGDVHGDYPALLASCAYILNRDPEAALCFCGDIIDRGPDSLKCALRLLDMLLLRRPEKTLWLRGNHEDALKFDGEQGRFRSGVNPAGFADLLNEHPEYAAFGHDLLRFIRLLPSAVFLPDGLLFTHAGVPMGDLLPGFASVQDMNRPQALSDFCWVDLAPDTEHLKVIRASRRIAAGRVNIDEFFLKCAELGIRADRIVAGHRHPGNGFSRFEGLSEKDGPRYPRCKRLKSALILHGSAIAESGPDGARPFAVARYRENETPEVKILHFKPSVFDGLYS